MRVTCKQPEQGEWMTRNHRVLMQGIGCCSRAAWLGVLCVVVQGCQARNSDSPVGRIAAAPEPQPIAAGTGCTEVSEAEPTADAATEAPRDGGLDADPADDREPDIRAGLVRHVMIVSVDGLGGSYLEQALKQGTLPNFAALESWGASTTEARSDFTHTITLPNHASILSGRPVSPVSGLGADVNHGYTQNVMPEPGQTLHNSGNPNLHYVRSVFDVAHDHGLRTCFYAGKSKFILFARSYDSVHGDSDQFGSDDGRRKIDRCVIAENRTAALVATAVADVARGRCDLVFIHIPDLDALGHQSGWGSESWLQGLRRVDEWVGELSSVAAPGQTGRWGIVLTADHGGRDQSHEDATLYEDYRIPFFSVAPSIPAASDLYSVVAGRRLHPGSTRPDYLEPVQPIRNLDAADAALSLLGLEPIPGSFAQGLLR